MLTYITGNLFVQDVQCIVNPVNTVGVMGKGLALEFKKKWPAMFSFYKKGCHEGIMDVGKNLYWRDVLPNSKGIILLATKKDWRDSSELQWIRSGLEDLSRQITELGIKSIALPWLGCGLGNLKIEDVRPLIEDFAAMHEDCDIRIVSL